uniref:Uncharacterized protein n=1 Tax=Anguilla anguilla TaxID=7936 RepID=A0A0E9VQT3_ANGAN
MVLLGRLLVVSLSSFVEEISFLHVGFEAQRNNHRP